MVTHLKMGPVNSEVELYQLMIQCMNVLEDAHPVVLWILVMFVMMECT